VRGIRKNIYKYLAIAHMVFDSGYDIDSMRSIVSYHPWKVIWVMEKDATAKFGHKFGRLYGIPA